MNKEFLEFKLRNLRFAVALSDINFAIGSVNPSGIKDEVYFIPKKDISAWPSISDDFLTADDIEAYTVLDGDFTLASGKKWIRLYTTQGKGKITAESTGEADCKMFVNKASLSYPKITNEARGFAKYAANGDFVFIVKHDGKITPGRMSVVPVGVWNNILKQQRNEEIH